MPLFEELSFGGTWRRYQKAAIAAFERDRAEGRRRTHIVAPPGSGKTVLGVELVRRVGRRALVLTPGSAVQIQWPRAVRQFGAPSEVAQLAGPEPAFPIACMTYESLTQLENPDAAVARAADAGVELAELLPEASRKRIQVLNAARIGTIVLDECHNLASSWGPLVRAVLDQLRGEDVHVIGLTPTPPSDLPDDDLYAELLGPVDFTVATPAVVREGHLAPYQELAWLTEPVEAERAWLAEHEQAFRELQHDPAFRAWAEGRPETGRGRPPDLDDWLVLLEGYAVHAPDHRAAVAEALADLGFKLTPEGVRPGSAPVDRLLTGSQSKARGLVEVLAAERQIRGDRLRALVLCDAESAESRPDPQLGGVLDPAAGTARHALHTVGADPRTAPLRPLVVSERGLRCLPADADVLLAALVEQAEAHLALPDWEATPDGVLILLRSSGAEWVPRAWVELATRVLVSGVCGALIGTRSLLGAGWECPQLNCLVDLTVAASGASVQQVRGRALRPDPGDPQKLASNWEIVCAAPELVRGGADYARFASKHRHLYAPADDGELEAGPSHAHVELGPFAPPPSSRFAELNQAARARAAALDQGRERWRIGEPYRGAEVPTLVLRHQGGTVPPRFSYDQGGTVPPRISYDPPRVSQRLPLGVAAAAAVAAVAGFAATRSAALLALLALVPLALGWAALRLARLQARLPVALPLERAARAVAEAYRELGELSDAAAGSLAVQPREAGYLRCVLKDSSPEESARFTAALDELVGITDAPRRLVTRPLPDPQAGAGALLARVLTRRPPFPLAHHPVPHDLARSDERAAAFARAWSRDVGPTELLAGDGSSYDGGYETVVREIWI